MATILVTGANGQLGNEIAHLSKEYGQHEFLMTDVDKLNITSLPQLKKLFNNNKVDYIINCAAYTDVDKAEDDRKEAEKVNITGISNLAKLSSNYQIKLFHFSTDYVFDGKKGSSYVETDAPDPLNTYGKTKLEGELAVKAAGEAYLIFRTSWVFSLRQGGFVTKVLQWARQQTTLRIVDDQIGSPTWSRMLAEATAQVIAQGRNDPVEYLREKAGLYHLAGAGTASRYEWARAILELDPHREEQVMKELLPAKTSEFPTPAVRPMNTGLDCELVKLRLSIHELDLFNQMSLMFI